MSELAIDRLGKCPNCKATWNGGDIRGNLSRMDVHQNKSQKEMDELAAHYGWTPENGKEFSLATTTEYTVSATAPTKTYITCPNCQHVFDEKEGEEYLSLYDAKRLKPIVKKKEVEDENT